MLPPAFWTVASPEMLLVLNDDFQDLLRQTVVHAFDDCVPQHDFRFAYYRYFLAPALARGSETCPHLSSMPEVSCPQLAF